MATTIGSFDTSGEAYSVVVVNNIAYVADRASGLQIIDVSNPATPVLLKTVDTSGDAQDVAVAGNYAYVADRAGGLQIIDITNPSNATLVGNFATTNSSNGVAVVGNTAFVADFNGLFVINVTDPVHPTLKASTGYIGNIQSVTVEGTTAIVASGGSGFLLLNITNVDSTPVTYKDFDTLGFAKNVTISGTTAYVADDTGGFQLYNIGNPSNPIPGGNRPTNFDGNPQASAILGDTAFVAAGYGGLQVISLTDPAHPTLLEAVNFSGYAHDVVVNGDYAYVADGSDGLKIVSTAKPSVFSIHAMDAIKNEGNTGNTAFTFTVSRTDNLVSSCTVAYQVGNASAGVDFFIASDSPLGGTLSFAANEATKTITVQVIGDTVVEPHQTFDVVLSSPYHATLSTATKATGTILNDDALNNSPVGSVIISNASPQTDQTLTVTNTLSDADGMGTITYTWLVNNTSVSTGDNYHVSVDDIGKNIKVNASYTDGKGTAEMVSSAETSPVIKVDPGVVITPINGTNTGEDGTSVSYSVSLKTAPALNQDVTISFLSRDTSEGKIDQPTLTFNSTNWSTPQTLTIDGVDDYLEDGNILYDITAEIITLDNAYKDLLVDTLTLHLTNLDYGLDKALDLKGDDGGSKQDTLTGGNGADRLHGLTLADNLSGGIGNDMLWGGSGNDKLFGESGNDKLYGESGSDSLNGSSGNDVLLGEAGKDKLTGGSGADKFKFSSIKDSGITSTTRDTITDFKTTQGDKIDLSAIDANTAVTGNNAFSAPTIGGKFSGSFANPGDLYFDKVNHILYGNNDTDATADFSILLTGVTNLSSADFIL